MTWFSSGEDENPAHALTPTPPRPHHTHSHLTVQVEPDEVQGAKESVLWCLSRSCLTIFISQVGSASASADRDNEKPTL